MVKKDLYTIALRSLKDREAQHRVMNLATNQVTLFQNQTWVDSLMGSKVNLPSCGEGKSRVYCRAPSKESRATSCSKHPNSHMGVQQSIFKGQMSEGTPRVCDQLVHNSLIG